MSVLIVVVLVDGAGGKGLYTPALSGTPVSISTMDSSPWSDKKQP